MPTKTEFVEVTIWSHPSWSMELYIAGGPDDTRKKAEEFLDKEHDALTFECNSIATDEYAEMDEFQP